MTGYYHSVETFGTVDGPGIRYVLFLSGCRLRCSFCHNPDTWEQGDRVITVTEVLADVERYRNFYDKSGGGITVSGGEPLLQDKFVAELFRGCQERGIHTLLDTSGCAQLKSLKIVLPYTNQIQFSIKAVDPVLHKQLTVTGNEAIFANLHYAASQGIILIIRYVIIPGVTDAVMDIQKLAELVKSLPGKASVELLGYHTLGLEKWKNLDVKYELGDLPDATLQEVEYCKSMLCEQGIVAVV